MLGVGKGLLCLVGGCGYTLLLRMLIYYCGTSMSWGRGIKLPTHPCFASTVHNWNAVLVILVGLACFDRWNASDTPLPLPSECMR